MKHVTSMSSAPTKMRFDISDSIAEIFNCRILDELSQDETEASSINRRFSVKHRNLPRACESATADGT